MLKLKTRWFKKWADKKEITTDSLLDAINRLKNGLGIVDLGGNLYKMRIGREGQGRSSGYRTIIIYQEASRILFIYGFEKSDQGNIDKKTLADYKKYAKSFLELEQKEIVKLLETQAVFHLEE